MMRKIMVLGIMLVFIVGTWSVGFAEDMEILGVTFPGEKVIEGKTLKLLPEIPPRYHQIFHHNGRVIHKG